MLFSLIFYHVCALGNDFQARAFLRGWTAALPFWAGSIVGIFQLSLLFLRGSTGLTSKPGAVPMNFAAKLNVLAAYAAFAFVCAIVFGMV